MARSVKVPVMAVQLDATLSRIGSEALKQEVTRLLKARARIAADPPKKSEISFQHTVLCQTFLPHRPTLARVWEQEQGNVSLRIEAGSVKKGWRWVEVGMPHGEKPRLLMIYLISEALRTGNPMIDVGELSMTAFVRTLGMDTNGPNLLDFQDQLTRLAAANVRFAVGNGPGSVQGQMNIVEAFDLWWSEDGRKHVTWTNVLRLSDEYFASLDGHAVPLDERALAALKHSSLCLDVYCWLAQRLHRISPARPQSISWAALKEQFGQGYGRERAFRPKFIEVLQKVLNVYPSARMEVDAESGLILFHSPTPVPKRLVKGGLGA